MRKVRGSLGQLEFAEKLGTTQQMVSHWENGRVKPTIDILFKLSENYSCDLNWLITGAGKSDQVAEAPVPYNVDQDMADLARALERHPRLVPIVRGLLKIDGQLVQDSESLSRMLDVPIEVAALFLAMKHHHHAK